jgi:cyanate permease
MPVLFQEIADDLGLDVVQIGWLWGMASLGGIFIVLAGGLFGDKFGVKRVLAVACLLAGITGALRGVSGSYVTLALTIFVFGLIQGVIPVNVHKTARVWFSGRRLGTANGVLSMGMGFGFTVGAMISSVFLSPLLGGWRNVLFFYGAISIVIAILWSRARERPDPANSQISNESAVPFRQALSQVARNKTVWLFGLVLLGQVGAIQGVVGYLPWYLKEYKGWSGAQADGTLAAFNLTSTIFTIPLALLSDRLGSRRAILIPAMLVTVIGIGLLSVVNGAPVWILAIMIGIFRDGFMAVFITMIMESKGVGAAYAGTAVGLAFTIERIGVVFAPPLGNRLANINPGLPFVFWAALAATTLLVFCFMKTKGSSINLKTVAERKRR